MFKSIFAKIIFILSIFFVFNDANAEMIKNAGLVGSSILTTNETPVVGETVRLSIPIYNETKGVVSMNVRMYENGKKIAEKPLTLKTGEFSGFSAEWKAVSGSTNFEIKLEDTFLQLPKSAKEIVVLENRYAKVLIKTQSKKDTQESINSSDLLKEYDIPSENQIPIATGGIDAYRQDFLYDAENKIKSIKQDISENVKQNEEYEKRLSELRTTLPRADGSLMTPLQYLYAWALGAVAYVLSNKYLFYGLCTLLIFLVLRFMIRRFRNHRHHMTHR